jgi:hypothetical protein
MLDQKRAFEIGGGTYIVRFTQNAPYGMQIQLNRLPHEMTCNAGAAEIQFAAPTSVGPPGVCTAIGSRTGVAIALEVSGGWTPGAETLTGC